MRVLSHTFSPSVLRRSYQKRFILNSPLQLFHCFGNLFTWKNGLYQFFFFCAEKMYQKAPKEHWNVAYHLPSILLNLVLNCTITDNIDCNWLPALHPRFMDNRSVTSIGRFSSRGEATNHAFLSLASVLRSANAMLEEARTRCYRFSEMVAFAETLPFVPPKLWIPQICRALYVKPRGIKRTVSSLNSRSGTVVRGNGDIRHGYKYTEISAANDIQWLRSTDEGDFYSFKRVWRFCPSPFFFSFAFLPECRRTMSII